MTLADVPTVPLVRGSEPLYRQLAQILRTAIVNDRIARGAVLPPELELAQRFRVSRITVRQALQNLEAEGLIRRERAKGTFVLGAHSSNTTGWVIDTLQDVVAFGERTRVKVKSFRRERLAPEIAGLLNLRAGEHVPCVRGLRTLEGVVLGEFSIYLTPTVGNRLTPEDLRQATIFGVIQDRLGIPLVEARQTVWADRADQGLARTLKIKPGTPLLCVRRVYVTMDQVPVEVATTRFCADRYRLEHTLKRIVGAGVGLFPSA